MDAQQLIQDGCQFAKLAVSSDEAGNYKVAIFYYLEAAEALKKALDFDRSLTTLHEQAIQYLDRAETLHQQIRTLLAYLSWFLQPETVLSIS